MAEPSRPPSFKQYGTRRECYACGRKLRADDLLWFAGRGYGTVAAVFGFCSESCDRAAARWNGCLEEKEAA